MFKKSSIWFAIFIAMLAIALLAGGCAKKSIVYEESASRPVMEAKKEAAPPAPQMEQPKALPPPAPKVEAAPAPKVEAVPPSFNLGGMRIQFAFDDYSLANHSKENLEKIAGWMKSNPDVRIQIQGNTCNIGTAEYNLALGEQRATSAQKYLEQLGVDAGRISTISYGIERPRVPNTDEANRSLNRRDEFVNR